jgi:branched-chain amino acid transport system substrate-binding protein
MIRRRTLIASTAAAMFPQLSTAAEPYVIGTLFPMAGPNAEYGQLFTTGAEMALTHIAADKMLQRPLELRSEDSQGTPQGGAIGMTKLVNVAHAIYVLVGFTGVSKAAAPIGARAKVILVNGGGVGPDLSGLSPYLWNDIPLANKEVGAIVPWLIAKGLKRVAAVYINDPYGIGVLSELQERLPKAGGELTGTFSISPTMQQFAAVAAQVREGKPDAVYLVSYGAQQSEIIKQLRDNGVGQQLLSQSGANIPSVLNLPQAEGLVITAPATNWESDDPVTKRFVTDWRAKYHSDPSTYHQNYYNAVRLFALLAQGLEKAGKPVDGDNLRDELLRVKTFSLVGGAGSFDDKGDISMAIDVKQLKGGKLVKIA